MPIRVKLRLEAASQAPVQTGVLESAALVNTGYTAGEKECSLPAKAAEQLGLWPRLPAGAMASKIHSYGGEVAVVAVPDALHVRVLADDRESPEVKAWVLITETDEEILISDALISALGIVAIDAARGVWCFRDEMGRRERSSEPPRYF